MKVPSITEMAMIQGLMAGFSVIFLCRFAQTAFAWFSTLAVGGSCYMPLGGPGLAAFALSIDLCRFAPICFAMLLRPRRSAAPVAAQAEHPPQHAKNRARHCFT
jgi:hypothetical protein